MKKLNELEEVSGQGISSSESEPCGPMPKELEEYDAFLRDPEPKEDEAEEFEEHFWDPEPEEYEEY